MGGSPLSANSTELGAANIQTKNKKELNRPNLTTEFIEWFIGLCDAESNFLCRVRKDKLQKIIGFEFVFRIALHIDDIEVLKYIQTSLGCGSIQSHRNTKVFRISKLEDIEKILFPIFDFFPLNTKKHLDYLDFKKAYFLFVNKNNLNKQDAFSNIITIKNSMNDKRINFNLPEDHVIRITGHYLVGLLEGDGSFYLNKQSLTPHISLVTITQDKLILVKIREFLLNQLDAHSKLLGTETKLINIFDKKTIGNNKPISILEIYQIDYLCNILIPYLDNLKFRTKKYLDYLDFKTIAFLIFEGKYLSDKGKELIINLADRMNNGRLSTNSNKFFIDSQTKYEIDELIKSKPLISIDSEGRAMIIKDEIYIRSTYIIQAILPNGSNFYFSSAVKCANYFQVSNSTIGRRLNDGKSLIINGQVSVLMFKRIRAYSPTSSQLQPAASY